LGGLSASPADRNGLHSCHGGRRPRWPDKARERWQRKNRWLFVDKLPAIFGRIARAILSNRQQNSWGSHEILDFLAEKFKKLGEKI